MTNYELIARVVADSMNRAAVQAGNGLIDFYAAEKTLTNVAFELALAFDNSDTAFDRVYFLRSCRVWKEARHATD